MKVAYCWCICLFTIFTLYSMEKSEQRPTENAEPESENMVSASPLTERAKKTIYKEELGKRSVSAPDLTRCLVAQRHSFSSPQPLKRKKEHARTSSSSTSSTKINLAKAKASKAIQNKNPKKLIKSLDELEANFKKTTLSSPK